MSLAGPWGEAACKHCKHLQDLDGFGFFIWHPNAGGAGDCPGSRQAPEATPKELDALAFSSAPVVRRCPHCGIDTPLTTIRLHRSNWRYNSHRRKTDEPAGDWCPGSGLLVGYSEADEVMVEPLDEF